MSGYRRTLAVAAIAASALFVVVGASSAGTGWTLTKTLGLSLRGTPTGKLAPGTTLHVSVALKIQHKTALQTATRSGHPLTAAQFRARYAPSATAAKNVAAYLKSQGFHHVSITRNRLFVAGTATAKQAERAFHTSLATWKVQGKTLYANSTAARVPMRLGNLVLSVLGLNDAARLNAKPADTVPNYLTSYNPQGFWKAYDAGKTSTGLYTAIAIFGSGDMTGVVKDLRTEETANKLPQVPVTVTYTGPVTPQNGNSVEWDMDTQYSTGMAGTVSRLYIYSASTLTDSDLALAFNKFAAQNLAKAGSASFGECEYQSYLDGSMFAWDQIFAEAAAQGQTVFASSGDTGGFCPVAPNNGVPAGIPDVNYPASSPYVVSVGGTSLFTNADGSYNNETAWFAGGGGVSYFEFQPYWQDPVAIPTGSLCVDAVACAGKNIPDIAMDADPESGANVYAGGQPEGVGGTSLASPLSLGVWARMESAHGNKLGFAAPDLYRAFGTAGYHDIQLGDVGPYPATPGYDLATGMGTFDIAKMNALIKNAAYVPGGGPAVAYKVSTPECTVVSDQAGDSSPITATDNGESTDILAAGFATSKGNLTAKLRVDSLSAGPGGTPGIAGDGDVWYVTWTYNKVEYFLSAETPGTSADVTDPLPTDYSYGTVTTSPTGGLFYNSEGSATGSMNVAKNEITITAPLSLVGKEPLGAYLTKTGSQTYADVGTPVGGALSMSDSAGPGASYLVGTTC